MAPQRFAGLTRSPVSGTFARPRFFKHWKDHLVIVKPETVLRWHRNGLRYYWKWKSRGKPGQPSIERKVIHLIRRMSTDNMLWRAPHPVRTRFARLRGERIDGGQVHGQAPGSKANADLAIVPRKPPQGQRRLRFLHRADTDFQGVVCLRRALARSPQNRPPPSRSPRPFPVTGPCRATCIATATPSTGTWCARGSPRWISKRLSAPESAPGTTRLPSA